MALCAIGCSSKGGGGAAVLPRPAQVSFEIIDSPSLPGAKTKDTGYWPTLLTDPQGGLHVTYCDADLGDAKIAHRIDGKWQVESIEARGAVGKYISSAWGPEGPEAVYLDQSRKMLRYAKQGPGGWTYQDIVSDNDDLGISGRFRVGPGGERVFVYYNTRNELMMAVGTAAPTPADSKQAGSQPVALVWNVSKLGKAGVLYNIQLDFQWERAGENIGRFVLSYPDWRVNQSTLYFGILPTLAAQKEGQSLLQYQKIDEDDVAGLKSQLIPRGNASGVYDLLYMSSRGGHLYFAEKHLNEWKRTALASNIANIAALRRADGRLIAALQVGQANGLGEGALHYGMRDSNGVWQQWELDGARPVGNYLSIAERTENNGAWIWIAYYDSVGKQLKLARAP